jgi:tetratricopeptide (TPR) repeat protein
MKDRNIYLMLVMIMLFSLQLGGQFTAAPDKQARSGYDEKDILKKQADRVIARREYEKANTIYQEMMTKYPDDWQIVEMQLTNLLRLSKFDDAETLLAAKKAILPEYNYLTIKIPLLISQGEIKEAEKLGDNYIINNKTNIKSYQDLALLFSSSRQYDKASEILLNARSMANDEYLFTLDLSRIYQSAEENDPAIRENLKHLERNKPYLHYVMNNLKSMLNRDRNLIKTIADFAGKSESLEVKEVYALCLAHIGEFEQALEAYRSLERSNCSALRKNYIKAVTIP